MDWNNHTYIYTVYVCNMKCDIIIKEFQMVMSMCEGGIQLKWYKEHSYICLIWHVIQNMWTDKEKVHSDNLCAFLTHLYFKKKPKNKQTNKKESTYFVLEQFFSCRWWSWWILLMRVRSRTVLTTCPMCWYHNHTQPEKTCMLQLWHYKIKATQVTVLPWPDCLKTLTSDTHST